MAARDLRWDSHALAVDSNIDWVRIWTPQEGTGTPKLCGKLQQFGNKGYQGERNRHDTKINLSAFVLVSGLSPFDLRVNSPTPPLFT